MIYQTQTFFTPFQFVSNKVYTFNFTINKFHVFSFFHAERSTLLNNINKIDNTVLNKSESVVTCILPYGIESLVNEVNLILLMQVLILLCLQTDLINQFITSRVLSLLFMIK